VLSNLTAESRSLLCPGNGLTAGARIEIDLNGHSIAGAGGGVGISVAGRTGVSVSGGTVRNFEAGVRTVGSTGVVIRANEFLGNTDGVDLQIGSAGNTVKENAFRDNRSRGIMLRSGSIDNRIEHNTFPTNRVASSCSAPWTRPSKTTSSPQASSRASGSTSA
jgi:parallel beta-helix repeat protein